MSNSKSNRYIFLVTFILVLVALPIFLLTFGWPLPSDLPKLDNISQMLSGNRPVPNSFIINLLITLVWFLWVNFLYVSVVEAYNLIHNRETERIIAIPGVRFLVVNALASIYFFMPSQGANAVALDNSAQHVLNIDDQKNLQSEDNSEAKSEEAEINEFDYYVVQSGDSWWSIAEDKLGDGFMWEHIRSANIGNPMTDGTSINEKTEIIHTGWELKIPNSSSTEIPKHIVNQGETLNQIAKNTIIESSEASQVTDKAVNEYVNLLADHNNIKDRNLITPGQTIELLDSQALVGEINDDVNQKDLNKSGNTFNEDTGVSNLSFKFNSKTDLEDTRSQSVPSQENVDIKLSEVDETDNDSSSVFYFDIKSIILGMGISSLFLSKNILKRLRSSRKYKMANRPSGMVAIEEETTNLEVALHTKVENLETELNLEYPDSDRVSIKDLWVSVGQDCRINLAEAGLFNIVGDQNLSRSLTRSIVHELATSVNGDQTDIRTIFDIEGVSSYSLVSKTNLEQIIQDIYPWIKELDGSSLDELDQPPTILILEDSCVANLAIQEILKFIEQRRAPIYAVLLSENPISSQGIFLASDTQAKLFTGETIFIPQLLDAQIAEKTGELLENSLTHNWEPIRKITRIHPEIAEEESNKNDVINDNSDNDYYQQGSDSDLQIRLLGDMLVEGHPDLTAQQLSLITYLACCGPAKKSDVLEAIWDGQRVSNSRFANLFTETRKTIGRRFLPAAKNGKYALVNYQTDLEQFENYFFDSSNSEKQEALSSALELVQSRPFSTPQDRYWTWVGDSSGLGSRVESLVAEAAVQLAEMLAFDKKYEKAIWACQQGLLAAPLDEHLVSCLAGIYMNQGNPSAAIRIVDEWELSVSRLGCGDPSTMPRQRLKETQMLIGQNVL